MTSRARLFLFGALLGLALAPDIARAQAAVALTASADVNANVLTISNVQNLTFGTVIPGTPTTINPKTGTTEGYFVIQGARNAEINVTFTLPTVLTAGVYTMPISFGAGSACSRPTPTQANCVLFDPSVALIDRIRNQNAPNNHYHIWMGGTVSPTITQHGGVYYGTITMTVVYTGN